MATYTVLIPPTRVTEREAEFVNGYRRENRITMSETLRRCVASLRKNGKDIKKAPYGSSQLLLPGFLVDEDTAKFINETAYEHDISRCQIVRSAIDYMIRHQGR